MIEPQDIEELKRHFNVKVESGKSLPNVKSVSDNTPFYLKQSDGVYVEYIMFNGKWHKKVIDANSNVTLEEV